MLLSSAPRPPPRNLEDETCSIASPHQSLIAGSIAVDEFVCPSTGNRFPTSLNFAPDHTSLADLACSFDHLVGAGQHCRRHLEAKRLGGLQVDHQLVLGRRLYGKIGCSLALQDAVDVARRAPERIDGIRAVRNQA